MSKNVEELTEFVFGPWARGICWDSGGELLASNQGKPAILAILSTLFRNPNTCWILLPKRLVRLRTPRHPMQNEWAVRPRRQGNALLIRTLLRLGACHTMCWIPLFGRIQDNWSPGRRGTGLMHAFCRAEVFVLLSAVYSRAICSLDRSLTGRVRRRLP